MQATYGPWLALTDPALWQEIILMAARKGKAKKYDMTVLAEMVLETGSLDPIKQFVEMVGVKKAVEAVGVKKAVEAVGAEQVVDALGVEEFLAALSPQQREELLRAAQRDKPGKTTRKA